MLKQIDDCIDCTQMGLHCIGKSCQYRRSYAEFCDECEEVEAKYCIDGKVYCYDCAAEYLDAEFLEMSVLEKADILGIDVTKLYRND